MVIEHIKHIKVQVKINSKVIYYKPLYMKLFKCEVKALGLLSVANRKSCHFRHNTDNVTYCITLC